MTKLCIPQVGDKLKLSANWDCRIFNEYRNATVFKGLNVDTSGHPDANIAITFPKGTVLRVTRLYVRAGPASSFNSITFMVESCPIKSLNKAKFWVKLLDANHIEFEEISASMDSQTKVSALKRFVALQEGYKNSERLSAQDANDVARLIYEHFKEKHQGVISVKLKMTPEAYSKTNQLDYAYWSGALHQQVLENIKTKVANQGGHLEVQFNFLPILDGFVYLFEEHPVSVEIDKSQEIYGKTSSYWRHGDKMLGSVFSYNTYALYDKSGPPHWVEELFTNENLASLELFFQDKPLVIKDAKAFKKFIKSLVNVPKQE